MGFHIHTTNHCNLGLNSNVVSPLFPHILSYTPVKANSSGKWTHGTGGTSPAGEKHKLGVILI